MSYKDEHERLLEDLAQTIGSIYKNVPLGSVVLQRPQLADVIDIKPSYTRFCLTIYEVKVSRSDFLSDVRSEKWKGYLEHCHRFYFATPAGIITKKDIPDGAGWIAKGEKGWSVAKASAFNYGLDIPRETILSMLFMRQREPLRERHIERLLLAFQFRKDREKQARLLGREIAEAYANKEDLARLKKQYEKDIERINTCIREALGVDSYFPIYDLKEMVSKIKEKAREMGI